MNVLDWPRNSFLAQHGHFRVNDIVFLRDVSVQSDRQCEMRAGVSEGVAGSSSAIPWTVVVISLGCNRRL